MSDKVVELASRRARTSDATVHRPWMKFFPNDWTADENLRRCSLATRGFFASCLVIMHKADPYGHVLLDGERPTYNDLAQVVQCTADEAQCAMKELLKKNVVSITPQNVVYSRRMVRDESRRLRGLANAQKGAEVAARNRGTKNVMYDSYLGVTPPPHPPPITPPTTPSPIASGICISSLQLSDAEISSRTGELAERYPGIYLRVRQAHYQTKPVRDYPNFGLLVRGWPLDRLEKMLEVFLLMPAKEAHNIPGTPGQFLNMAPECDRRLREHGL